MRPYACLKRVIRKLMRRAIAATVNDIRLQDPLIFGPPERVHADPTAVLQNALLNTVGGDIRLEPHVSLGHNVSLLTGTHLPEHEDSARQASIPRQGRDIIVRRGAWIASNATVIGPCEIGAHAVVAAGAVVTRDVRSNQIVAGVPARPMDNTNRDSSSDVRHVCHTAPGRNT